MVRYLLEHRIAVLMTFLALVILGCVTYVTLPVSLLPDIDIPHITVQMTEENVSARELENTVVAPVRRQLLQVSGLQDLKSETRDGSAVIRLTMDYGVNTDLAFIEVNEKIDGVMTNLPSGASRPKAVKASATDVPVLYLNLTLRGDREGDDDAFMMMGEVADNIVRRRLEQLPEVAMVDVTGIPGRMLRITPRNDAMAIAGVTVEDIESALNANNAEPGSMTVRDGYYEYNIQIANLLRTPEDVGRIKLRKGDRVLALGDLCDVALVGRTPDGYSIYDGKRAITMAVIKHSRESMASMKKALNSTIDYFSEQYPDIEFTQSRNQTELLEFTISNLEQNLILGLILVFFVCLLFMGDLRSPLVIGINILVALVVTFLLFYLFKVTLNIISLSGLILAVGMMIDNSVIVTENITQMRHRGMSLTDSCIAGTNEMITPMLSSSLTTVAVFLPLIFMSGIAGAIFTDQAFSITAGLASSYVVGITLLPVLYFLCYRNTTLRPVTRSSGEWMLRAYDHGVDWVFAHKALCLIATAAVLPLCVIMFVVMRHERMPAIDHSETLVRVDWNENINLDENLRRVGQVTASVDSAVAEHSAAIGMQDYILNSDNDMSAAEADIYLRVDNPDKLAGMQERVSREITSKWPKATVSFSAPENIFEKIFSSDEAAVEARIFPARRGYDPGVEALTSLHARLADATSSDLSPIPMREQLNISVDRELLAIYNVDYQEVQRALRTAFKGNSVTTLRSYQEYIPIHIAGRESNVEEVLNSTLLKARPDRNGVRAEVPLSRLINVQRAHDLKSITSGAAGEYVAVEWNDDSRAREVMTSVRTEVNADPDYEVSFTGSFFSNEKMMRELMVILAVSLLLMYFILCAQFESFMQPLIVLLEIPVDTAFALITLWIFGHTLNLMSAIGIIVTCGIVVNDSILKLDAINELRKTGVPLIEAIHTAGRRRLRPIVMTSLTTIFAMVPQLFASDMGSELQQPLAIAMIGSMVIGTVVSIFIIPLVYWFIYRKSSSK